MTEDDIPDFQIPYPDKYKPTPVPEHNERWTRTRDGSFNKEPPPKDAEQQPQRVK